MSTGLFGSTPQLGSAFGSSLGAQTPSLLQQQQQLQLQQQQQQLLQSQLLAGGQLSPLQQQQQLQLQQLQQMGLGGLLQSPFGVLPPKVLSPEAGKVETPS